MCYASRMDDEWQMKGASATIHRGGTLTSVTAYDDGSLRIDIMHDERVTHGADSAVIPGYVLRHVLASTMTSRP